MGNGSTRGTEATHQPDTSKERGELRDQGTT